MGEAKLYGQKSGGMKINGIIKEYYAYAGENISAGDLVEFINGVAGKKVQTTKDTLIGDGMYTMAYGLNAVALDEHRVFVLKSRPSTRYPSGMVLQIDGTNIIAGTETVISETGWGNDFSLVKLDENRVFIACATGSSYYLYGIVCMIDGITITKGTGTNLKSTTNAGYVTSATKLDNSRILIAHSYGSNYYLYGIVVSIDGTTISKGTDTAIDSDTQTGNEISTVTLNENKAFVSYGYDTNYRLMGQVCTISDKTITSGTRTQINSSNYTGRETSTIALDENRVFIAYSRSSRVNGVICTINDTTITIGTGTILGSTEYTYGTAAPYLISAILTNNGKIFVILNSSGEDFILRGLICTINSTTITAGADTILSNITKSGYAAAIAILEDGNFIIVHTYESSEVLYGQLWGVDDENNIPVNEVLSNEYETQVRKTTTNEFAGVANTSGVGGDSSGHNDILKIYTI